MKRLLVTNLIIENKVSKDTIISISHSILYFDKFKD